VLSLAGVIALLYVGKLLFITLITASILAFILDPFVEALIKMRLPRSLASFLVCVAALLVLYLIGLGVYAQLAGVYSELGAYSERVSKMYDAATMRLEDMEQSMYRILVPRRVQEKDAQQRAAESQPSALSARAGQNRRSVEPPVQLGPPPVQEVRILPERTSALAQVISYLGPLYDVLLLASFVPFLVYFMLSWRDHVYRGFLMLFDEQARPIAGNSLARIAYMVRGFVVGNFVLGLLLAVASSLVFVVFGLPYPLLTGPLSGFLSLIPYAGLLLAMLPPLFAALTVYQNLAPYVLLAAVVAGLHLLALNLLYPKIVGGRVHLNPLVVTVALMVWGVLWGGAGLVLAIPITAGIKAVCDNVNSLRAYGSLLGD
jgi:predicted PurR-regulated permease PerM